MSRNECAEPVTDRYPQIPPTYPYVPPQSGWNILTDILSVLKNILDKINKFTDKTTDYGTLQEWAYRKDGKYRFYERTITYTGLAQTADLNVDYTYILNRIEQIWSDATARDFSIRTYASRSGSEYSELDAQTTNTGLNRISPGIPDFVYSGASRIQLYYANTTAGKTVKIIIVIEET